VLEPHIQLLWVEAGTAALGLILETDQTETRLYSRLLLLRVVEAAAETEAVALLVALAVEVLLLEEPEAAQPDRVITVEMAVSMVDPEAAVEEAVQARPDQTELKHLEELEETGLMLNLHGLPQHLQVWGDIMLAVEAVECGEPIQQELEA